MKVQCKLCGEFFDDKDMSDEHYPARSTGNVDIGGFDIIKFFDLFMSGDIKQKVIEKAAEGQTFQEASDEIFDEELFKPIYAKGRTARTLCVECNRFLGKYDEAYLKFFNADGNPKTIKGFQKATRIDMIKAIYAKFLSVPETSEETFDFVEFVKNKSITTYNGKWNLYFVKRDQSADLLGLADIGTGKAEFDEGIVYELSDEKFIFNLMNFKKHPQFEMNNIFDILQNGYHLIEGVGEDGGYHAQILMTRIFKAAEEVEDEA